jgi:type II secretory pathway pseudopilin PulG
MRGRAGVTLIEILLATIILTLGFIGILAIFPSTIESSKQSMEESQAALLGESVQHALKRAMRGAAWDAAAGRHRIVLTHDLRWGAQSSTIELSLPTGAENWVHFPGAQPTINPEIAPAFDLGQDPWISAAVKEVRDRSDASEPYDQFQVSFDMKRLPGSDPEGRTALYDVRIHILRRRPSGLAPTGEAATAAQIPQSVLVDSFSSRIWAIAP